MVGGIILGIVLIACIVSPFIKNSHTNKYAGKIVSSHMLNEDITKERGKELPQINPVNGSTNNYARLDKSWSSFPDFVVKLVKGWRK